MRLLIFGSGGLAREVFSLVEDINRSESSFNEISFLDINEDRVLEIGSSRLHVFNDEKFFARDYTPDSDRFAIGIGSPDVIKKIISRWGSLSFPNLVHPSVIVQKSTLKLGKGNIICAGNVLTTNIVLGSFNYVNLSCTIGHDSMFGDGNVINPGANISGSVKIGNYNLIGTNATILQGVEIKDHIILGASSLANKNLESDNTYIGVPARPLKR